MSVEHHKFVVETGVVATVGLDVWMIVQATLTSRVVNR
jgi:hypothetical protein